MSDRTGIFAGDDPFQIAKRWLDEATVSEPNDPTASTLATVDDRGMPNIRVILLKAIEHNSFVFFTNYSSRKGREIASSGKAAINIHWKSLGRQIRVRGAIAMVSTTISDEYYQSRPLGSRISAWASQQSEPLDAKATLVRLVRDAEAEYGQNPKRPPHWGGYRLTPTEIEFWAHGEHRLHDRFRWQRADAADGWRIQRLNP
ncbi:MAG: pyridoxamine 5'-phosphate oxidase [Paracoccaceae bacterium]